MQMRVAILWKTILRIQQVIIYSRIQPKIVRRASAIYCQYLATLIKLHCMCTSITLIRQKVVLIISPIMVSAMGKIRSWNKVELFKPWKNGRSLTTKCKQILLNVYSVLQSRNVLEKKDNLARQTSTLTGVGHNTITKI